jgi:hypothetical protein
MSGLFGGGGDDEPAPTRSPKGVKISPYARTPATHDSILARGVAANAGSPMGMLSDDERPRNLLGSFGEGR